MSFFDVLLQQIINGVSLGAMYALLALGFTMVYGIIELINFAHFNVFMVGSFVGLWVLEDGRFRNGRKAAEEESPGSIDMRCRITSGGGDPRESATENEPLRAPKGSRQQG